MAYVRKTWVLRERKRGSNMLRMLLFAAAALIGAGTAEARTIVLDTQTTDDFILSGGPVRYSEGGPGNGTAGNPVRLISFDIVSTMDADVFLDSTLIGSVVAGELTHFAPDIPVLSLDYGWWFGHLVANSTTGYHRLATWSNVTLDLGDLVTPLPEPANWALMIGGFGLAGAAMRRRNRSVAIA